MKHGIIYLLLTLGVVLTGSLPFTSHDVGELRPVKTVLVRVAPGTVFFGTASYLLLEESALDLLSELPQERALNPGCALCLVPAGVDLEAAGSYFDAHEPGWDLARLRRAQAAGEPVALPGLVVAEGRYLLVQPGH